MASAPLRRPSTYEEGVAQLRRAVADTTPNVPSAQAPRCALWAACRELVDDQAFVTDGLRQLYDANQVVSFLFHTMVPHLEERLRYTRMQDEYDAAMRKPDSVAQNTKRFDAVVAAVIEADDSSCARSVEDDFARMRAAIRPLTRSAVVVAGLRTLYVSSKIGRKSIDLILQRLIEALRDDVRIVKTTEIPIEALLM